MKMIPMMDGGDDVGMVLSPQCFHNLNAEADIFNHSNIHFWECALSSANPPLLQTWLIVSMVVWPWPVTPHAAANQPVRAMIDDCWHLCEHCSG